jgi:hypothetical protein
MPEQETIIFLDHETDYVACPGCADESMRTLRIPITEPIRIFCDFCDILILDQLLIPAARAQN